MRPEDIAKLITEDPDILAEDACPVCGGEGEAGFTSFACSNSQCQNFSPRIAPSPTAVGKKWSLRVYINDNLSGLHVLPDAYSVIKQYGGMVVGWKEYDVKMGAGHWAHDVVDIVATFDSQKDAEEANKAFDDPNIPDLEYVVRKVYPASATDEVNYEIGEKDMEFVMNFHLS
jgi:hypothetical protein